MGMHVDHGCFLDGLFASLASWRLTASYDKRQTPTKRRVLRKKIAPWIETLPASAARPARQYFRNHLSTARKARILAQSPSAPARTTIGENAGAAGRDRSTS
jgi:hypothetical protein